MFSEVNNLGSILFKNHRLLLQFKENLQQVGTIMRKIEIFSLDIFNNINYRFSSHSLISLTSLTSSYTTASQIFSSLFSTTTSSQTFSSLFSTTISS
jgi:hypothetical protein